MGSLFDFAAKFDPTRASTAAGSGAEPTPTSPPVADSEQAIFEALEKLGDLKQKGILTDEEFEAQKTRLLSRL